MVVCGEPSCAEWQAQALAGLQFPSHQNHVAQIWVSIAPLLAVDLGTRLAAVDGTDTSDETAARLQAGQQLLQGVRRFPPRHLDLRLRLCACDNWPDLHACACTCMDLFAWCPLHARAHESGPFQCRCSRRVAPESHREFGMLSAPHGTTARCGFSEVLAVNRVCGASLTWPQVQDAARGRPVAPG